MSSYANVQVVKTEKISKYVCFNAIGMDLYDICPNEVVYNEKNRCFEPIDEIIKTDEITSIMCYVCDYHIYFNSNYFEHEQEYKEKISLELSMIFSQNHSRMMVISDNEKEISEIVHLSDSYRIDAVKHIKLNNKNNCKFYVTVIDMII